jgi:NTE family protein
VTLALVLGGGGVAGVAWHTGVLLGLAESGADPSAADLLVGTSAGSTVAAQLGAGHDPGELFARQVDPATLATERPPPVTVAELLGRLGPIYAAGHDDAERRRLRCAGRSSPDGWWAVPGRSGRC